MPLTHSQLLQIPAEAAFAIPAPDVSYQTARDELAFFFARLRTWGETHFAVVGDGLGTVVIASRPTHVYARLDSANGDIIEARVIMPMTLAQGDGILVKRENPGGPGGWLVLDFYGMTNVPVCSVQGVFYINLGNYLIYRVDSLAAGGGSATLVNSTLQNTYGWNWLYAPTTTTVILFAYGVTLLDILRSTDGGMNYVTVYSGDALDGNSYALFQDLLFPDLAAFNLCYGYNLGAAITDGFLLYTTNDSGATWTRTQLHAGAGVSQDYSFAMPRHNGADAFIYAASGSTSPPFAVADWFFDRVDATGAVLESYAYPSPPDYYFIRGCMRYGDLDTLHLIDNNAVGYYQFAWSTKTLTPMTTFTGYVKQIMSTRVGTLLVLSTFFSGGVKVYVYRSTDGGSNWTLIDLSGYYASVSGWNYIGLNHVNELMLGVEDGTILFSTDDGATWQLTSAILPFDVVYHLAGSGS